MTDLGLILLAFCSRSRSSFSPTTQIVSSSANLWSGVSCERASSPSSIPTTIQLYSSRMPLSERVLPKNCPSLHITSWRSFISLFSMSGSSGWRSLRNALPKAVSWSSSPITYSLSPGNIRLSPLGILMRWVPRRMLLTFTPNRPLSFMSASVLPAQRESSGTSKSEI